MSVESARFQYADQARMLLWASRSHDFASHERFPSWTLANCRECAAGSRRVDAYSLAYDNAVAQAHSRRSEPWWIGGGA